MNIITHYGRLLGTFFERDNSNALTWISFHNFGGYPEQINTITKGIQNLWPTAIISKGKFRKITKIDEFGEIIKAHEEDFRIVIKFDNEADETQFMLMGRNITFREEK
jgi:hypothetical protein